jgi:hypothetical protein
MTAPLTTKLTMEKNTYNNKLFDDYTRMQHPTKECLNNKQKKYISMMQYLLFK